MMSYRETRICLISISISLYHNISFLFSSEEEIKILLNSPQGLSKKLIFFITLVFKMV